MKRNLLRFVLLSVMSLVTLSAAAGGFTNYLCFTASEDGSTIALKKVGAPTEANIKYQKGSTSDDGWTAVEFGTPIELAAGQKVFFYNDGVTGFSKGLTDYYQFEMTGSIAASGNVMSLVDKNCENQNAITEIPCDYCFHSLFNNCKVLTTAPELPATTLAAYCYSSMFQYCTALTTAPELPATTLAAHCYSSMFKGCTALKTAPELPATTLAKNCYYNMFYGCIVLNDIKVAFTAWDTDDEDTDAETAGWVGPRIGLGTFTCPKELDTKTFDTDHVPITKNNWTIKTTYDLEVTTASWASMCVNLPLTVPEGAEVYYASAVDGNTITLTQISENTVMAAKTAVIVKKPTEGTTVSFPVGIAVENGTITSFTDNLFQGSSVAKAMVEDVPVYVLSGANATNGNPQFQNYTGTTLGAHKIWLPKSALGGATGSIQFRFDDATAINNVPMESSDNAIYNLAGQRVSSDYRGLVIKNGKKTWNN